MKYNIRKNWVSTAGLMKKNGVLLLPFIFIAFFEFLALEVVCFSSRKPLVYALGPIIKKFFGEEFLHYPGSTFIVPQLFYYVDVVIYIFISVTLMAMSVNIFKNIKEGLPVRFNAIAKNALKKYVYFVLFGILAIFLMTVAKKADIFVLKKVFGILSNRLPYKFITNGFLLVMPLSLFIINVFLQVFTILTIPVIVLENKSIFRALWKSVATGFSNFFTLLGIILLPFLVYLPIMLLKSRAVELADKTFPAFTVLLTAAGIVAAVFIDAFILLCATQFLIDKFTGTNK